VKVVRKIEEATAGSTPNRSRTVGMKAPTKPERSTFAQSAPITTIGSA
jgi:hypothetical protein